MRKAVICLAGAVIVGMLVYPPWKRVANRPGVLHRSEPYGYALLWQPPPQESIWCIMVDYGRLSLQVGAVAVAVLLIVLPQRGEKNG